MPSRFISWITAMPNGDSFPPALSTPRPSASMLRPLWVNCTPRAPSRKNCRSSAMLRSARKRRLRLLGLERAAALDIQEELHLAGVGLARNIRFRADNRCLPPRLLNVGENHVEHPQTALEQSLNIITLFERVATGGHDAHADAALDQTRDDEVRQWKALSIF